MLLGTSCEPLSMGALKGFSANSVIADFHHRGRGQDASEVQIWVGLHVLRHLYASFAKFVLSHTLPFRYLLYIATDFVLVASLIIGTSRLHALR
jgi:hypothetical protein